MGVNPESNLELRYSIIGYSPKFQSKNVAMLSENFQRFQNKVLHIITNAPWYVPYTVIESETYKLSPRRQKSHKLVKLIRISFRIIHT